MNKQSNRQGRRRSLFSGIYLYAALTFFAGASVCPGQTDSTAPPPAAQPAPPPAAPVQRSEADLEKLVAPIALYPDPLLASLLPACAYPIQIVQAARFIQDTNNISKVDSQSWDKNVKAIARFPKVVDKLNADIGWTSDLGEAFVQDQKGVMNAIQAMREKAEQAGNLKTTPQQTVVVTNSVTEKTVEQQVVYVTNTIVQIQPAQPDVIYVPQYNPTAVYVAPTPGEVAAASLVSFGVGMAVGAVLANNCNWHAGGVYVGGGGVWAGGYHGNVYVNNVNRNVNVNNFNRNVNVNQNWNRNVNQNWNRNANVNQNFNRNANFNQSGNVNRNLSQTGRWQPSADRSAFNSSGWNSQSRGWGGATSSGFASSEHSAFNSFGGAAQTRQFSDRGASSWGGGGFHGGGGFRR